MTSFRITALIAASAFGLAVAMPAFAVDSPSPTPDKPKAETSGAEEKEGAEEEIRAAVHRRLQVRARDDLPAATTMWPASTS